jgi:hypothetical protein
MVWRTPQAMSVVGLKLSAGLLAAYVHALMIFLPPPRGMPR